MYINYKYIRTFLDMFDQKGPTCKYTIKFICKSISKKKKTK